MNKWANSAMLVVLCWGLCLPVYADGPAAISQPVVIVPKTMPTKVKIFGIRKDPVPMPFYVYNNAAVPAVNNFAPSGYMGDVGDIKVMGSYTNLHQADVPCLKIGYGAGGDMGWGGLIWQNPANNWGELDGGYNLTKAKKLSFWARGENGGEVVEFKLGGMAAKHPDSDTVSTGSITLKKDWTQYKLDLNSANLAYISGGFGVVLKQDNNPKGCTFYLDDIKYEE